MKTGICCIVKNEQKYIKEWVDYHLNKVGIDHIYIYEDYGSDSHKYILSDFNDRIEINSLKESHDIPNYPSARTLFEAYKKYLNETEDDWVLFTDIDEFLTFEEGWDLDRLLQEHSDWNGIWLWWKMYNANGRIKTSNNVIDTYTSSINHIDVDGPKWRIKSFVNTKLCRKLTTLHEVEGGKCLNGLSYLDGPYYHKAWLNHYFTKSWEDWCVRIFDRGNMLHNYRTLDTFFLLNLDMLPLKEKLIYELRYRHAKDTMWLSRDLKLISGGNINHIKELQNDRK